MNKMIGTIATVGILIIGSVLLMGQAIPDNPSNNLPVVRDVITVERSRECRRPVFHEINNSLFLFWGIAPPVVTSKGTINPQTTPMSSSVGYSIIASGGVEQQLPVRRQVETFDLQNPFRSISGYSLVTCTKTPSVLLVYETGLDAIRNSVSPSLTFAQIK